MRQPTENLDFELEPMKGHHPPVVSSGQAYAEAVAGLTEKLIEQANRQHWQTAKRWTMFLLLLWGLLTFIVSFAASSLSFDFFGWSFSFWLGAQGSLIAYVLLITCYAWAMNRADRRRAQQIQKIMG